MLHKKSIYFEIRELRETANNTKILQNTLLMSNDNFQKNKAWDK